MRRLLILLPLVALAGCQSKPSLVGDWTVPIESLGVVNATFSPSGDLSMKGSALGYGVNVSGTYKTGETELTVEPKDVNIQGDVPALLRGPVEKEVAKVKDKPVTFAMKWTNADTVDLEPLPGSPASVLNKKLTLTRVKK